VLSDIALLLNAFLVLIIVLKSCLDPFTYHFIAFVSSKKILTSLIFEGLFLFLSTSFKKFKQSIIDSFFWWFII
jgi:hypothetical protein